MSGLLLTFSERRDILYELLSLATRLADENRWIVGAVNIGQNSADPNDVIGRGADRVFQLQSASGVGDLQPQQIGAILQHIGESDELVMALIGATREGNETASRLAQMLGVGCVTGCLDLEVKERKVVAWRSLYGGKFTEKVAINGSPAVVTVLPRRFTSSPPNSQRKGEVLITEFKLPVPPLKVISSEEKTKSLADLEGANIIISGGRGFKKKEDLQLLEELAKTVGGAVAGTRPLTEDMDWLPADSQVGLSGKKVNPKLYIACGVSGQIQHIIGMRDSKVVVSINIDENAPIFQESDYYIVSDLYEVLPTLTRVFKEALGK